MADRLVTTEVAGLATALRRPSEEVQLAMTRLSGERLEATVSLPDEVSTVILRAHAWRQRLSDTDAVDIWRSLEIAYAAGVTPSDLERSDEVECIEMVRDALSGRGASVAALGGRFTRARALAARVLGIQIA